MRKTYVYPVIENMLREWDAPVGAPESARIARLYGALTEVEADFVAIVGQAAEVEVAKGFRNLHRWWMRDSVEALASHYYGWRRTGRPAPKRRAG